MSDKIELRGKDALQVIGKWNLTFFVILVIVNALCIIDLLR